MVMGRVGCVIIATTSKFQLLNMEADSSLWKSLVRKLSGEERERGREGERERGREGERERGRERVARGIGLWCTHNNMNTHILAQFRKSPAHVSCTADSGERGALSGATHNTH